MSTPLLKGRLFGSNLSAGRRSAWAEVTVVLVCSLLCAAALGGQTRQFIEDVESFEEEGRMRVTYQAVVKRNVIRLQQHPSLEFEQESDSTLRVRVKDDDSFAQLSEWRSGSILVGHDKKGSPFYRLLSEDPRSLEPRRIRRDPRGAVVELRTRKMNFEHCFERLKLEVQYTPYSLLDEAEIQKIPPHLRNEKRMSAVIDAVLGTFDINYNRGKGEALNHLLPIWCLGNSSNGECDIRIDCEECFIAAQYGYRLVLDVSTSWYWPFVSVDRFLLELYGNVQVHLGVRALFRFPFDFSVRRLLLPKTRIGRTAVVIAGIPLVITLSGSLSAGVNFEFPEIVLTTGLVANAGIRVGAEYRSTYSGIRPYMGFVHSSQFIPPELSVADPGKLVLHVMPKTIVELSSLLSTSFSWELDPYVGTTFTFDRSCQTIPISYNSFWGLDNSLALESLLIGASFLSVDVSSYLKLPKSYSFTLLPPRYLQCQSCSGCLGWNSKAAHPELGEHSEGASTDHLRFKREDICAAGESCSACLEIHTECGWCEQDQTCQSSLNATCASGLKTVSCQAPEAALEITAPARNSSWAIVRDMVTIEWTGGPPGGDVRLFVRSFEGQPWIAEGAGLPAQAIPNSGSYSWNISQMATSRTTQVAVVSESDPYNYYISDEFFVYDPKQVFHWEAKPWSDCFDLCGGRQYRSVFCMDMTGGWQPDWKCEDPEQLLGPKPEGVSSCAYPDPDIRCHCVADPDPNPAGWETCRLILTGGTCNLQFCCNECRSPCQNAHWVYTDTSCSKPCGTGVVKFDYWCRNETGHSCDQTYCFVNDQHWGDPSFPPCNTHECVPEVFDWVVSNWGECSESCGVGIQAREVKCVSNFGKNGVAENCTGEKPAEERACPPHECPEIPLNLLFPEDEDAIALNAGESYFVPWEGGKRDSSVTLQLVDESGVALATLADAVPTKDFGFNWTVPQGFPTRTVRVRIQSSSNASNSAQSRPLIARGTTEYRVTVVNDDAGDASASPLELEVVLVGLHGQSERHRISAASPQTRRANEFHLQERFLSTIVRLQVRATNQEGWKGRTITVDAPQLDGTAATSKFGFAGVVVESQWVSRFDCAKARSAASCGGYPGCGWNEAEASCSVQINGGATDSSTDNESDSDAASAKFHFLDFIGDSVRCLLG